MALLTLDEFRDQFPTFSGLPDERVQAALDAAAEEIDETVWGSTARVGHGWLTAHKLDLPITGAKSVFGAEYQRLVRLVGGSYRVVLE